MNPVTSTSPATVSLPGPEALRALARTFAHVSDFQRFTAGLEQVLARSDFFAEARVELLTASSALAAFGPGRLTLPLAGAEGLHGALHVAGAGAESRPFGPEDQHQL
jgi:hypothetical protein